MRAFKVAKESPTDRDANINRYFSEVQMDWSISTQEEFELTKRVYETGCQKSKDILVKANLRFVISVAKSYYHRGKFITLSDLINQGNIGLIESIDRFDPYKGFKLISYAVWHIRKEIIQYISSYSRHVSIPHYKTVILMKIGKIQTDFLAKHERMPTNEELLEKLDEIGFRVKNESELNAMNMVSGPVTRLEGSKREEDEFNPAPINVISDSSLEPLSLNNLKDKDFNVKLSKMLSCLSPREKYIFCRHHGFGDFKEGSDLNRVAEDLELSREGTRLILKKAKRKIQRKYGDNKNTFLVNTDV